MNRNMLKQEGLFRVSGNNWGLACPFEPIVCRRGYCDFCEIYHDWQKLGEIIVICAWCSNVIDKKPGLGKPVVSHGICLVQDIACGRIHETQYYRSPWESK